MNVSTTPLIVVGASGRMGSRVCALAMNDPSCALRAGVARQAHDRTTSPTTSPPIIMKEPVYQPFFDAFAGVVIDFSSDAGADFSAELVERTRSSLLVGTTALSSTTLARLKELSTRRAVMIAPNTSLGVAVLARIARDTARALGPGYDASIVESHHNQKKDAPSGTALRLAVAVRGGGAKLPDDQIVSVRGGDVIGEHTIRFAAAGEYIELTHRATSRDLFARGALRLARWLHDRPAGWYTVEDALDMPAT